MLFLTTKKVKNVRMIGRRIEYTNGNGNGNEDVKLFKPIELTSIFHVNLGLQTVGKTVRFPFFYILLLTFV